MTRNPKIEIRERLGEVRSRSPRPVARHRKFPGNAEYAVAAAAHYAQRDDSPRLVIPASRYGDRVWRIGRPDDDLRKYVPGVRAVAGWYIEPDGQIYEAVFRNPIEGMPGGSVSGCIAKYEDDPEIQDPGAYCAAIADQIEPGWRQRNPQISREQSARLLAQNEVVWVVEAEAGDSDPELYDYAVDAYGTFREFYDTQEGAAARYEELVDDYQLVDLAMVRLEPSRRGERRTVLRERNPGRQRNELMVEFRQPRKLVDALRGLGVSQKTARKIVDVYPEGRGLQDATLAALQQLGATEPQAKRIRSAFEVVRVCDEACEARLADGWTIRSPEDAVAILRSLIGRKQQEYFAVILLDSRKRILDVLGVSVGSLAEVPVHPREVFREAVRRGADSVIVAHNHPSGDAQPSRADFALTERLSSVGRTVGIPVVDHIVVTGREHVSLASLGHIPSVSLAAEGNPDDSFLLTGKGIVL